MRLLHTGSVELKDFMPNAIPEYAILSHTWGDEEVTLQDIERKNYESKKGFAKLKGVCALAARDKYDWIWIDNCCIDKSSSSELQESINSMWKWYRNANLCYVFLSDISSKELNCDIKGSRWFTRAWTLQELIAPESLEFYNLDWAHVGTKHSMASQISSLTQIRPEMLFANTANLSSVNLSSVTAAEIMSWAAHRKLHNQKILHTRS